MAITPISTTFRPVSPASSRNSTTFSSSATAKTPISITITSNVNYVKFNCITTPSTTITSNWSKMRTKSSANTPNSATNT